MTQFTRVHTKRKPGAGRAHKAAQKRVKGLKLIHASTRCAASTALSRLCSLRGLTTTRMMSSISVEHVVIARDWAISGNGPSAAICKAISEGYKKGYNFYCITACIMFETNLYYLDQAIF